MRKSLKLSAGLFLILVFCSIPAYSQMFVCPQTDLSNNCYVDFDDVIIFGLQWLGDPNCPDFPGQCADLNSDQRIDIDDFTLLADDWSKVVGPAIINELLASNSSPSTDPSRGYLVDEDGNSSDWIELHNISGSSLNLSGWFITNDDTDMSKWQFPEGTSIQPNGYLVIFASEKDRRNPENNLHTNFKLNKDGDYLALVRPDGSIAHVYDKYEFDVQQFGYPPQKKNYSYGMLYHQTHYFALPTPGKENKEAFEGYIGSVEVSHPRGFYNNAIDVKLTCETSDARIRYTLNGSNPTEAVGIDYDPEKLIHIDSTTILRAAAFKIGYQRSRTETNTYIFIEDVITQCSDSDDKPGDDWPNETTSGQWIDYGMDTDVTQDERYEDLMDEALLSIPSMSITTDLENLFNSDYGIYVNARRDGREWERPCSLELIDPNGLKGFQVNAGLRIRGGFSRSSGNPKHSWRFFFRSEYGDSSLNYPLFGDEGTDRFDKLDFRTAQNYSWSFKGKWGMDNGSKNTMCREIFSRDTQREMGQHYTRSRYYHVYLNGQYWGLYQTQERSESRFAESYMGGDKDHYDVAKVMNDPGSGDIGVTDGNIEAYKRLWKAASDGFESNEDYYKVQGLNTDGTVNPEYEKLLDPDNLIDYMAIIYYTGNFDAPISNFRGNKKPNNYFAMYNRVNPDGWKFFAHDSEHTLFNGWDRTGPWTHSDLDLFRYFNPQWLHQRLLENPEYNIRFADRMHKYLFNGGLLTPEPATERFLSRAKRIETAIIAESARWGDSKMEKPRTRDDDWIPEINRVVNEYFPFRFYDIIWQLRLSFTEDFNPWYPWTDAPVYYIGQDYQHGGMVYPDNNILNIMNPNFDGDLWYTLDGTEPRLLEDAPPLRPASLLSSFTDEPFDRNPVTPLDEEPDGEEEKKTIFWITDSSTDSGFTELLEDKGYIVYRFQNFLHGVIDPYLIEYLNNNCDLIIVSSSTLDINYNAPGSWNSITTPLILLNGSMARSIYWDWFDSDAPKYEEPKDFWTPTPDHPIFFNISLTGGDHANIVTSDTMFNDAYFVPDLSVINGQVLGCRIPESENDQEAYIWLALWDPGSPFYSNSLQTPNGGRLYFACGDSADPQDSYNLNDTGEQLFLNAVEYMIDYEEPQFNHAPYVWAGWDQYIMWPRDTVELYGWVYDDGIPDDPNFPVYHWSMIEGPADVNFSDPNILYPTVTFSQEGIYQFMLEAFDGEKTGFDLTTVFVAQPIESIEITKSTRIKSRIFLPWLQEWSALTEATYGYGPIKENLRISEIMYNPNADPNEEYIELINTGTEDINIHWVQFTEGIKFTFPDMVLASGERTVVVRNTDAFEERYGEELNVAGQFEGALDDAGEKITLTDAIGQVIHSFKFKDSWHEITDGEGFSLTLIDPFSQDPNDWYNGDFWRPSVYKGGSPDSHDDSILPNPGDIVINEVLAHSHDDEPDLITPDWIEVKNTSDYQVNISGWFLSDSNANDPNRMKFRIPSNTTLNPGQSIVFKEDESFGNVDYPNCLIPFALSEGGESVYIRSRLDTDNQLTGYFNKQTFKASETDVTMGRFVKSTGTEDFVAMRDPTPAASIAPYENTYPKVGPIVITEIMFNPPMEGNLDNDEYEFIELLNISDQEIKLESKTTTEIEPGVFEEQAIPWKFTDGIEFEFPPGTVLEPNKRIILVRNEEAFDDMYGSCSCQYIFEWESGRLNNDGEELELSMPGDQEWRTERYYIRVDKVNYGDSDPWPQDTDAQGKSLHRIKPGTDFENYGNDPANWESRNPSPGS